MCPYAQIARYPAMQLKCQEYDILRFHAIIPHNHPLQTVTRGTKLSYRTLRRPLDTQYPVGNPVSYQSL